MSAIVLFGRFIRINSCLKPPFKQNKSTFSLFLVSLVNSSKALLIFESDSRLNFMIKFSICLALHDAILKTAKCTKSHHERINNVSKSRDLLSKVSDNHRSCECKPSLIQLFSIIPRARVGYQLAITSHVSNKREWNNCFIKFSLNSERLDTCVPGYFASPTHFLAWHSFHIQCNNLENATLLYTKV